MRGHGYAFGHHGELLQGQFSDVGGTLHRALISLPCTLFRSDAVFDPIPTDALTIQPAAKVKALAAARIVLATLGRPGCGGAIRVHNNIPDGWGLGSSTADIIAVTRAICDAFGTYITADGMARVAVSAETASDPIMLECDHVLFAQREGRVLERMTRPFPPMTLLGFNTSPDGSGVDTLGLPAASYGERELEMFGSLRDAMRRANAQGDLALIGEISTRSATINQAYLPKPHFAEILEIAREAGAVGIQVAHSGTVIGFIFDPRQPNAESQIEAVVHSIGALGFAGPWRFHSGEATGRVGKEGRASAAAEMART